MVKKRNYRERWNNRDETKRKKRTHYLQKIMKLELMSFVNAFISFLRKPSHPVRNGCLTRGIDCPYQKLPFQGMYM